jgi:alkylhydroperoxidase family enzyme
MQAQPGWLPPLGSIAAALRFALAVMAQAGHVSDQALREVREAGFDDAAIVEITVVVFLNVFTNAINHLGTAVEAEDRV